MVTLALALLLSQTPQHRLFLQPNLPQGASYAFFEAFPASGAGTSGACSTTPPTGAKGEALTFTRASNGTCTKTATGGLATTGIANGDLVVLSSNQPRVEYDSGGVLGLLVEASRTNSALRSEEFDNAAWTKGGAGAAAPTITANYAAAPDGTATADRVQFAACPAGGSYSVVYQTTAKAAGVGAASVFCRGTSADQTISVCAYGGTTVNTVCTQVTCPFASNSRPIAIGTAANTGIVIGCDNEGFTGGGNTGAADVLLWGAQLESGAYASSYIPTGAGTATRAGESSQFALPTFSTASGFSLSMRSTSPATNEGGVWGGVGSIYQDALNRTQFYRVAGNAVNGDVFSTSGNRSAASIGTGSYVANTPERFALTYSGAGASSVVTAYRAGVVVATSAAGTTSAFSPTLLYPGGLGATADVTQLVGEFCLDNSLTGCLR